MIDHRKGAEAWPDRLIKAAWIRGWLPARTLDWGERQAAAALVPLALITLASIAIYVGASWVVSPATAAYRAAALVCAAFTVGALVLLRQGKRRAANWVFVAGLAELTTVVMAHEGLRVTGLGMALLVLVTGALLLNWLGALLFGAYFVLLLLAVEVAEGRGWLVPAFPSPLAGLLVPLYSLVALTALLAVYTHRLRALVLELRRSERDLRASNQALAESREALALVISESPDAIITAGDHGIIQLVNRAAERLTGYAAVELVGRPFLELGLVSPESRARAAGELGRVLAGMEGPATELEIVHRDGTRIPVEVAGRMVKRGDGSMLVQAIMRDIRDRKQAERGRAELEAELRHAQRLESVGRLAGGIAHDFNNLLTVILSTSSTLRRHELPGDLYQDVEAIETAAERAAELTRQLLAFSRKQIMRPRVIELSEIVDGIDSILRRLLPERIQIVLRRHPVSGAIKADPRQIQQVVINLALNARDAMPAPGTLTIESGELIVDAAEGERELAGGLTPGRYARLTVADTGIGMDEETRAHVFEPFFTTKPIGQGTGMGLATAHGIVAQSGGQIRVRSQPGQGATFEILFPQLARTGFTPEARPRVATPGPDRARPHETILLVEDEEMVRQTTARILRHYGYEVIEASDASEALRLALARTLAVDLVVTDLAMPGGNGPDLVARLRTHFPVRVLYMSGHADLPLGESELLEHAAFLAKPFTPVQLARRVRELIDETAPARESETANER